MTTSNGSATPTLPTLAGLKLSAVTATPAGDHIRLQLHSTAPPPQATIAARAVGFPITPEVARIQSRSIDPGII